MVDASGSRIVLQPRTHAPRVPVVLLGVVLSVVMMRSSAAQQSIDSAFAWDIDASVESIAAGDPLPAATAEVDRLVRIALQQHPELSGAEADVGREAGLRFQSTRRPNPSIGYSASEVGNEGRAGQQGMYVSQEWVTAGRLGLAGQVGAWRTRAAAQRLDLTRLRLTSRVQGQYWMLVAARHRVTLLGELEELLEDGVRINQSLREAAEVGLGPVLQARLEKSQVSVAKRQAEADLNARTSALAATLGLPIDAVRDVGSDPWPAPLSLEELDAVQPWAASPELGEAQALIEAARWNLRLAQSQTLANVESSASIQHDAATDDVVFGLQIGMAIPVHDRKRGLIRAAHAELAQSEAQYARRYRDLQTRWAEGVGNYRSALEMVRSIEQELLGLAEERLTIARRAHQQGELDYLDLLTAQRSFLVIRQTALDAHQQAAVAAVRLNTLLVDASR